MGLEEGPLRAKKNGVSATHDARTWPRTFSSVLAPCTKPNMHATPFAIYSSIQIHHPSLPLPAVTRACRYSQVCEHSHT